MTNKNNIKISIDTQELQILRSAFLEICYGIQIDGFDNIFDYSKKECKNIFDEIDILIENLKPHSVSSSDENIFIAQTVSHKKLNLFYAVLLFVKQKLGEEEILTRTGFDDNEFDALISKIDRLLNAPKR